MKKLLKHRQMKSIKFASSILLLSVWFMFPKLSNASIPADSIGLSVFVEKAKHEISLISENYYKETERLTNELVSIDESICKADIENTSSIELLRLFQKKIQIEKKIRKSGGEFKISIGKLKYKKGIELIKMMYEKILDLDHHFTSLGTYQNVIQLSNPNSFPEFQKAQEIFKRQLKKKNQVQLPAILQSNTYVAIAYSVLSTVIGDRKPQEKEEDLEKISCILDFTASMTNDLHIIYYETEFLKKSNESLKQECSKLFTDYTKAVGYKVSLDRCRKEDDWESILTLLDDWGEMMEKANEENDVKTYLKGFAEITFAIDRMRDFLNEYSAFISQGEKYYQKFHVIVSNYKNEMKCANKLPYQFEALKKNINLSIEKFDDAYNIAELKGSKLKDLLYGAPEGYGD